MEPPGISSRPDGLLEKASGNFPKVFLLASEIQMFHLKTHQNIIDISWKMMWCQNSWNSLDFLIVFWYGLSSKLGYPRIHWFTRPCFWPFLLAIKNGCSPPYLDKAISYWWLYFWWYTLYIYISLYVIPQCIHHKTYLFFSVIVTYMSHPYLLRIYVVHVHGSKQHRPTNLWNNLRWSSFQALVTANSFQSS